MADPVQQSAGGEQIPAPVMDTSPAGAQTLATPEEKLPAPEPEIKEEPVPEHKDEETKVDTSQVLSNIEVEQTLVTNLVPELPSQKINDIKQEVTIPKSEQSDEFQQNTEGEVKLDPVDVTPAETSNGIEQSNEASQDSGDWQKRELELLKKIEELEKVKNARSEDGLRLELKVREEEIDLLKARVKNLETELQAALSKPGGKNHEMIESIKQQHDELLSKARGMIFDKTKMVKNQELQIEALTTQVQSLKDINVITKDLLEIRNSEVKAMEERFQAMDARFKAEKERYDLVLKRAQTSTNINDDLRKEYETQLAIFKELREKYELRVQALVAENNRLKEAAKGAGTSG